MRAALEMSPPETDTALAPLDEPYFRADRQTEGSDAETRVRLHQAAVRAGAGTVECLLRWHERVPVLHGRHQVVGDQQGGRGCLQARRARRLSDQPAVQRFRAAALAFATELTEDRHVIPDTFAELARHYSEREICDIVFLVAGEHLYNISNIGLNIGSAGMCEVPVAA
jgi:hypothetical protein